MEILKYEDYKEFVLDSFSRRAKKGHGQFRRLAQFLNIHPVIVSQVFKGERHLSLEQACDTAEYLGLTKLERDYFFLLVQHSRAGTHKLKKILKDQMKEIQEKSKLIVNRLPEINDLSEEAKGLFYSYWHFSALRLLSAIDGYDTVEAMSEYFSLPISTTKKIVEFLIANGLCVRANHKISMGSQSTHIGPHSLLVQRHHQNWRGLGFQKMESATEEDLFFTGPMVLSLDAKIQVRTQIVDLIERVTKTVEKADCESLACLNIDWFSF